MLTFFLYCKNDKIVHPVSFTRLVLSNSGSQTRMKIYSRVLMLLRETSLDLLIQEKVTLNSHANCFIDKIK